MKGIDRVHALINLAQRQFPKLDFSAKQIVGRILTLDNVFSRDFARLLAGYGITPSEFGILNVLRCQGSPYTLAPNVINQLHFSLVTSGGMTNILHGLEKRELVERLPDPSDGRGVLIRLTPKAIGMIDGVIEARVAQEHRWVAALDERERATLEVLLGKLLISLEPYTIPVAQKSVPQLRRQAGIKEKSAKSRTRSR
jgi:DNA-binding MarR family transcriptional regulator